MRYWFTPKRQSKQPPRDVNEAAFAANQRVIALTECEATGKPNRAVIIPIRRRRSPAAVALGRGGGLRAKNGIDKIDPMRRRVGLLDRASAVAA
jgi:hypothetical protein